MLSLQGHHVRGGGGEPVANKRPRLPKRRRQPSGLKERRKMERKSWEGGGREGASLRKRRRRHRCRGVINGRGRRGSVHLSYLCKKPKTARHPITTLANCYPVACLWLRKQILADWRRVGTRKVALDLASVLRLYGANNVSARCLLLSPPHPFCNCVRTFSTGNCQIECRAPLQPPKILGRARRGSKGGGAMRNGKNIMVVDQVGEMRHSKGLREGTQFEGGGRRIELMGGFCSPSHDQ